MNIKRSKTPVIKWAFRLLMALFCACCLLLNRSTAAPKENKTFLFLCFAIAWWFILVLFERANRYLDRRNPSTPKPDSVTSQKRYTNSVKRYPHKMLVYKRGFYIPVNLTEIAMINQNNQVNWLITFKGEEDILDLSLKEITNMLSDRLYFRINRNQIVHKEAIQHFSFGSFGKIELTLKINGITTTVSKDRAKSFRNWFYK